MPDGGILSLDWFMNGIENFADNENVDNIVVINSGQIQNYLDHSAPILLILHGMTGGSNENYVRHMILKGNEQRWNCVALNFRGAGDTPLKTPLSYSAAQTSDLKLALHYLHAKLPLLPLFVVGFSLGANVLVKYLGEESRFGNSLITAAVSISNPFNLIACSKHLEENSLYKYLYSKRLCSNLKNFLRRHYSSLKKHQILEDLDPSMREIVTLKDFDERITRRMFGYRSVEHYYEDASSSRYLNAVNTPLLCLNALDDPLVPIDAIPFDQAQRNPYVILITTKFGGHVGWIRDFGLFSLDDSWMDQVTVEFFHSISKVVTTLK